MDWFGIVGIYVRYRLPFFQVLKNRIHCKFTLLSDYHCIICIYYIMIYVYILYSHCIWYTYSLQVTLWKDSSFILESPDTGGSTMTCRLCNLPRPGRCPVAEHETVNPFPRDPTTETENGTVDGSEIPNNHLLDGCVSEVIKNTPCTSSDVRWARIL